MIIIKFYSSYLSGFSEDFDRVQVSICTAQCECHSRIWAIKIKNPEDLNLRMKTFNLSALGIRLFPKVDKYLISFRDFDRFRQGICHLEFLDLDFQNNCKNEHQEWILKVS